MKLLILGGTRFIGPHLVDAALARGHEVTLFNRCESNPEMFGALETIKGDRDGGLGGLAGREWDAVVDTCGYVPRLVGDSARALEGSVGRYAFVSTISVYEDSDVDVIDEDAALSTVEDETVEEIGANYGALKALCERVCQEVMGSRALIVRPGLICGPLDPTDRFTWWPWRMTQGGRTLAPGDPSSPIQLIDARDLAAFIVEALEGDLGGVYNTTGPVGGTLTMGEMLAACQSVSEVASTLTWVDEAFLEAHEVEAFSEMPLWVPRAMRGFMQTDLSRARSAGLETRPISQTARDTLDWALKREGHEMVSGMKAAREAALLEAWDEGSK